MEEQQKEEVLEFGSTLNGGIRFVTIIGEIEGHECLSDATKTTKYEHIVPLLVNDCCRDEVKGFMFLINTVGGDVSCGLALAELIASLNKPAVAYVLGDSHSIGVPLAVATDYTIMSKTATMIIHPVRLNGMVLGAKQTYDQFEQIEKRIVQFVTEHSELTAERMNQLMKNTEMMAKDLGTILTGEEAKKEGLVQEVGGFSDALEKLLYCIENG